MVLGVLHNDITLQHVQTIPLALVLSVRRYFSLVPKAVGTVTAPVPHRFDVMAPLKIFSPKFPFLHCWGQMFNDDRIIIVKYFAGVRSFCSFPSHLSGGASARLVTAF